MTVPRPNKNRQTNNMRRFKPGGNQQPRRMNMGGIGAMFNIMNNTNQIPSSGYLDFTEPTSNSNSNNTNANGQKQFKNNNSNNAGANGNATNGNNNKNRNTQRRNNNGQRLNGGGMNNNINMNGGNNRNWGNNNRNNNNMSNNMRQGGNMMLGGQFNGPPRMHPMGRRPNGPMPPMGMLPPLPPMPMNMNGRFPPRPLMPPPMMGQGPMRRPPNFRMGAGPFPNRGMMPRNNVGGPIRRNGKVAGGMVNKNNRRNGGNAQTNQKNRKKNQIKSGKRTNANVNKYALDKPWVNDEIKEAHQTKTDLENQLKGKKNDEIFAKFKEQRDKFVSLYDAAKDAYLTAQKKDKEKVLKESDTGEQKDTNNDVEMPIASAAS